MKKTLSFVLVFSMILAMFTGIFTIGTGAKVVTAAGNTWTGDEFAVEIKAGENGYTFKSVYQIPGHAYEMSGHMVSNDGGAHNDIPQTLILVDASKDYTWTPNGLYSFAGSNYEVLYCCDAVTGYEDGVYYKRMNLEDSSYYDEESAAHIRAIVTNSYPYVSLEQMKASLKADGFEGAEDLTRAEIISAVQSAIWAYANVEVGEYKYSHSFNVCKNTQWGTVMHDTSAEMSEEIRALGTRKYVTDTESGSRIDSLVEYLKNQKAVYAENNAIVISKLEIVDSAPVHAKADTYTVAMKLALNNSGSSEADDISIDLYVDGVLASSAPVELGKESYDLTVDAKANQTITAVVSGTQFLPQGVYFYEPEGGRDVSQSLVGVAGGYTKVYADASVTLDVPEAYSVTFDLDLRKIDEKGKSLTGASFDLYIKADNADLLVGTYDVDAQGVLSIEDLLPGSYILSEAVTPEGYEPLEGSISFTVTDDGKLGRNSLPAGVSIIENNGTIALEVVNVKIRSSISGIKYLDGNPASGFEFALMQGDKMIATAKSGKDGRFSFVIELDKAGEYHYTVVEIAGKNENIVYDKSVFNVTVTVDENAEVTVEYENEVVFNNTTVSPASAVIEGKKYLDGKPADGFWFKLTDEAGNEIQRVQSVGGVFSFSGLEFDSECVYTYYISEIAGDDESIVYDDSVFEVAITVTKSGETYLASVAIKRAAAIEFNNTTVPETTEPEETTEVPEETTEAPEETTEAPEETTEAPEETTEAPEETTEVPEVTTEPEEEITEEPTPLDPAPETTEPEEEITDPEVPLNPKTGDSTVIIVIAAIAALSLAVIYFKRRQTTEE